MADARALPLAWIIAPTSMLTNRQMKKVRYRGIRSSSEKKQDMVSYKRRPCRGVVSSGVTRKRATLSHTKTSTSHNKQWRDSGGNGCSSEQLPRLPRFEMRPSPLPQKTMPRVKAFVPAHLIWHLGMKYFIGVNADGLSDTNPHSAVPEMSDDLIGCCRWRHQRAGKRSHAWAPARPSRHPVSQPAQSLSLSRTISSHTAITFLLHVTVVCVKALCTLIQCTIHESTRKEGMLYVTASTSWT